MVTEQKSIVNSNSRCLSLRAHKIRSLQNWQSNCTILRPKEGKTSSGKKKKKEGGKAKVSENTNCTDKEDQNAISPILHFHIFKVLFHCYMPKGKPMQFQKLNSGLFHCYTSNKKSQQILLQHPFKGKRTKRKIRGEKELSYPEGANR